MPLLLGRGQGWAGVREATLEPEEDDLLHRVREAGPAGYQLEAGDILLAYSLYHRNLIVEHHDKTKPWTYILGRGWK